MLKRRPASRGLGVRGSPKRFVVSSLGWGWRGTGVLSEGFCTP